jgi:hypothetical protein
MSLEVVFSNIFTSSIRFFSLSANEFIMVKNYQNIFVGQVLLVVVIVVVVAARCWCLVVHSVGRCWLVHCSLEPVLWISGIGDGAGRAVRVQYRILSLHYVTVTSLFVVLRVSRQRVLNPVGEGVVWFSLRKRPNGHSRSQSAKWHVSKYQTPGPLKNDVFWDIKTMFILHRRHLTSPLQSPTS